MYVRAFYPVATCFLLFLISLSGVLLFFCCIMHAAGSVAGPAVPDGEQGQGPLTPHSCGRASRRCSVDCGRASNLPALLWQGQQLKIRVALLRILIQRALCYLVY